MKLLSSSNLKIALVIVEPWATVIPGILKPAWFTPLSLAIAFVVPSSVIFTTPVETTSSASSELWVVVNAGTVVVDVEVDREVEVL